MPSDTLVFLDLETTGLNSSTDKIIEIAAIKISKGKIVEKFDSLVNPGVKIPDIISSITGIQDSDVETAPPWSKIQEQIKNFLGDHILAGHNLPFDLSFLATNSLKLPNIFFDTCDLAGILLPKVESLSLETLTTAFNFKHENSHRAMSDVEACFELWQYLKNLAVNLSDEIKQELINLAKKCNDQNLKTFFEKEIFNTTESMDFQEKQKKINQNLNGLPKFWSSEISVDLNDLENKTKNIFLEESQAPAILQEKGSWVIAFSNKKIFDQFSLETNHDKFLYPRFEYPAPHQIQILAEQKTLNTEEFSLLAKISIQAKGLKNCDKILFSDLNINNKELSIWRTLSAQNSTCVSKQCPWRETWEKAITEKIIFTTNKTIFENPEILTNKNLLIQNAEDFAETALVHFSRHFSANTFQEKIEAICKKLEEKILIEEWEKQKEAVNLTFGLLGMYLIKNSLNKEYFQEKLPLSKNGSNIQTAFENLIINLRELSKKTQALIISPDSKNLLFQLQNLQENIDSFETAIRGQKVFSEVQLFPENQVSINSFPIALSEQLKKIWPQAKQIVALTKNTKTPDEQIYLRQILGAENWEWKQPANLKDLLGHLRFTANQFIAITDLPGDRESNFFKEQAQIIITMARKLKGKIFVLTGSKVHAFRAYEQIAPILKKEDITTLAEGVGGRGKIFHAFAQNPHSTVIFGTMNFFKKHSGEKINCLIVQKLPFDFPGNLKILSLAGNTDPSFENFTIPRISLALKKLADHLNPDGLFLMLDPRASNKNYGRKILLNISNGEKWTEIRKNNF